MILPGMRRETLGHKITKLHRSVMNIFSQSIQNGTIRFGVGWALYPDDADTSKMLVAVAEGRNEMPTGSSTENLLALNAHNRKETESPVTTESRVSSTDSEPNPAPEPDAVLSRARGSVWDT